MYNWWFKYFFSFLKFKFENPSFLTYFHNIKKTPQMARFNFNFTRKKSPLFFVKMKFHIMIQDFGGVVGKGRRNVVGFVTIGGTFTTLGLIDAVLYKVFKPKKL